MSLRVFRYAAARRSIRLTAQTNRAKTAFVILDEVIKVVNRRGMSSDAY